MNVSVYAIPGISRSAVEVLDFIIQKIYGKSFKELNQRTRRLDYVIPRQVAMTIMLLHGKSTTEVGKIFNLDHATAINARKVISNIVETKYPKHVYDRVILTFQRYKENFNDFEYENIAGYKYALGSQFINAQIQSNVMSA